MTNKQKKTLVLFAQNYTLEIIAAKMKVSKSTIKNRLRKLSKIYTKEFNNASSLRQTHRRNRQAIKRPITLNVNCTNIKYKF